MTRRIQWLLLLGVLAIAGCTNPGNTQKPEALTANSQETVVSPSPSAIAQDPPAIAGVQNWSTLLPGEVAHGLKFMQDGSLSHQGQTLLPEIPVSYGSDGTVTYAKRLIVSDPSPSGNFSFVKACESPTNETGLCWAVYLVNRNAGIAKQTSVGKYGGLNWVQWTNDERYAVLVERMEGVFRFIVVDLETGDSRLFDETYATADLNSFSWVGDASEQTAAQRTFQVKAAGCEGPQCDSSSSVFRGEIEKLFNISSSD